MRPPSPARVATPLPSITNSRQRCSISRACTSRGSASHTSAGGAAVLSSTVAPGIAARQHVAALERLGVVDGDELRAPIRYVERIGRGPKRRCEMVVEPDFFESYSK
jgi:hypothetical protein